MDEDLNLKEAEIYEKIAFDGCAQITTVNGNGKRYTYRVARVGVGDGLWVDAEGIFYVQRNGKFNPHYLIPSLFDGLLDKDFNKILSVPDSENPGRIKNVKAHQFGERSMMVGKDGVLYLVANHEKMGLVGQAKCSSNDFNSRLGSDLQHRTYELARTGYDPICVRIAREHIGKSGLSDAEKNTFNAGLDQMVQQYK